MAQIYQATAIKFYKLLSIDKASGSNGKTALSLTSLFSSLSFRKRINTCLICWQQQATRTNNLQIRLHRLFVTFPGCWTKFLDRLRRAILCAFNRP